EQLHLPAVRHLHPLERILRLPIRLPRAFAVVEAVFLLGQGGGNASEEKEDRDQTAREGHNKLLPAGSMAPRSTSMAPMDLAITLTCARCAYVRFFHLTGVAALGAGALAVEYTRHTRLS